MMTGFLQSRMLLISFLLLGGGTWTCGLHAQKGPAPDRGTPVEKLPDSPLKKLGEEEFDLGGVHLNTREQSVSFPAFINLTDPNVMLEYVLVHDTGKTHESLLRTDREPYFVHLAFLFLGVEPSAEPPAPGQDPFATKGGRDVDIFVEYEAEDQGKEESVRVPLNEWIRNGEKKALMKAGPWFYNGSYFHDAAFLAQREGSIVSIIEDSSALINNPRVGRNNDEIWFARIPEELKVGVPVKVFIQLRQEAKPSAENPASLQ